MAQENKERQRKSILLDYLKDLQAEIDPQSFKQLIKSKLNLKQITYQNLSQILRQGAQSNSFVELSEQAIAALIKNLELPLDDEVQLDPKQRLQKSIKKVIFANRLSSGILDKNQNQSQAVEIQAKEYQEGEDGDDDDKEKIEQQKKVYKKRKCVCLCKMTPDERKKTFIRQHTKNYFVLSLITLVSLISFAITAWQVPQDLREFAGIGIVISRGSAMSIVVVTFLCCMFITRDLVTCLRSGCCGRYCTVFLDEHILFHKFCGFLAMVYSVIHVIGHLFGSAWAISDAQAPDEFNSLLTTQNKFDRVYKYWEILFMTLPGVSGIILIISILLIWILSLPQIRRKKWQVFTYSHLLYFVFILGMIVHGSSIWLNPGFPLCSPFMIGCFVFVMIQLVTRCCQKRLKNNISMITITSDNTYVYFKLIKPKEVKVLPGQYIILNIPDISRYQWHAFSICSGANDDTINFIIKDSGDFTKRMIQIFLKRGEVVEQLQQEQQLQQEKQQQSQELYINSCKNNNQDELWQNDVKLQEKDQQQQQKEHTAEDSKQLAIALVKGLAKIQKDDDSVVIKGKKFSTFLFPSLKDQNRNYSLSKINPKLSNVQFKQIERIKELQININGPFGAPCQSAIYKKRVVFVGAGVGLTPFLAYLRTLPPSIKSMNFVFICRDPQLLRWITMTMSEMKYEPHELRHVKIYLFLTKRREVHNIQSFVFWKSFIKMTKMQEEYLSQKDVLFQVPIKVSYQRPNLKGILEKVSETSECQIGDEVAVYSCAPKSFNDRLGKICDEATGQVKANFKFYPQVFG